MRKIIIGIDPGTRGVMCVHYTSTGVYEHIPLADIMRVRTDLEAARVVGDCFAVIEDVHSMPGQGVATTFKFGFNTGMVVGMVIQSGIPYTRAAPQRWQRVMWCPQDKVSHQGKVDTKTTSLNAAVRLHPEMNFKRTERCKKFDDNMVDATLICDYAKIMNL